MGPSEFSGLEVIGNLGNPGQPVRSKFKRRQKIEGIAKKGNYFKVFFNKEEQNKGGNDRKGL